jgi:hypothetical protein
VENSGQHANVNLDYGRDDSDRNLMMDMILDVAGPTFDWNVAEQQPNAEAQKFYYLLKVAEKPLWDVDTPTKA